MDTYVYQIFFKKETHLLLPCHLTVAGGTHRLYCILVFLAQALERTPAICLHRPEAFYLAVGHHCSLFVMRNQGPVQFYDSLRGTRRSVLVVVWLSQPRNCESRKTVLATHLPCGGVGWWEMPSIITCPWPPDSHHLRQKRELVDPPSITLRQEDPFPHLGSTEFMRIVIHDPTPATL